MSPARTWEGLIGGALHAVTPVSFRTAAVLSLPIVAFGALGGLGLSALKRALGAKDRGIAIAGHGGFMDRLDAITVAAPVFFHLVRYFRT